MKNALIILFLAVATIAFPQTAGQPPAKEFTLTLNTEEINVILVMLSKGPYENVAPVIGKIQQQVSAQATPQKKE